MCLLQDGHAPEKIEWRILFRGKLSSLSVKAGGEAVVDSTTPTILNDRRETRKRPYELRLPHFRNPGVCTPVILLVQSRGVGIDQITFASNVCFEGQETIGQWREREEGQICLQVCAPRRVANRLIL